jgi:hypothetical protein
MNMGFFEQCEGLQDLMNWLINSHIANTRAHLNNRTVVDPSMVNIRDMIKPSPGGLIRLKKQAWKKGIPLDQIFKQVQVYDVTGGHVKDADMISSMMSKRFHATDALQGVETKVKRTATEIAEMKTGSVNHLTIQAILFSLQGFVPLTEQCVMNNQQFLEEERYYRIAGDAAKGILEADPNYPDGSALKAGPMDIQGLFDFKANDGTLPTRPQDFADIWERILGTAGNLGLLGTKLDAYEIFKEAAQALGAKDIERFQVQAQVLPDGQLMDMEQAGNVVPVGTPQAGGAPPV